MNLLTISRPRFWLYTAGPYAVAAAAAATTPTQLLSATFFLGLIYFLVPANVFLYGVNDLADTDTDKHNKKKTTKEHLLKRKETRTLTTATIIAALLAPLFFLHSTPAGIGALAFLLLGAAYSLPPPRFKKRRVIDSLSNILYIMPAITGYAVVTQAYPPAWAIIAGGLWAAAMHLYSAIPDIAADHKAGLNTTAVWLGEKRSLLLCTAYWAAASTITLINAPLIGVLSLIYPTLSLTILVRNLNVERLYWWYPYINGGAGFILFWLVL